MHRRSAERRRTRALMQTVSCAAMVFANIAISLLMASGFMASSITGIELTGCVQAGLLYALTFGLVGACVALDLRLRKQRRRLYRMLLCADNEK